MIAYHIAVIISAISPAQRRITEWRQLMRRFLLLTTAALAGTVFGSSSESGDWQIQVDLAAARQSAGARWLRNNIFTNLLSREVLPGRTVAHFWECGDRLTLSAPANGAWSNAVLAVEGEWKTNDVRSLETLSTITAQTGGARVYGLSSATSVLSRIRPSAYGALPDSNISVHPRSTDRKLSASFVARTGNRLVFSSDWTRLTNSVTTAARSAALQTKNGRWLDCQLTGGDGQDIKTLRLTMNDGESGELCGNIAIVAADAAGAARLAEQVSRLFRMFTQLETKENRRSVVARVRDSLNISVEGTSVTAEFTVPADVVAEATGNK